MHSITSNLEKLSAEIPATVQLVAVSKTRSREEIMEAYRFGHTVFGENKAQELIDKQPELPEDIEWHFIGHLQTNKVKYIASFVSLIHSADRYKVLKEINKQAAKHDRILPCLLQFHIAEEETKFGFSLEEVRQMFAAESFKKLRNIRIDGVMGMASFVEDAGQLRKEFTQLRNLFALLKQDYFSGSPHFKEISMGMSNDYKLAIEEGSTIIRVGSAIFGARPYH
ncbi:MAG: YggS family pyridoxal phosphate-dependent enzyme [Bacteroidales bacterium]